MCPYVNNLLEAVLLALPLLKSITYVHISVELEKF